MNSFATYFLLLTLLVLPTACSKRGNNPTSSLSGVVQLGRVEGATVKVFALDAQGNRLSPPLAETQTNSDGEYSLTYDSYSGPIEVVSSGGNFVDEATGQLVALENTDEISAIAGSGLASSSVPVTPVTALAIGRFKKLLEGQSNTSAALAQSLEEVAELWGTDLEGVVTVPAKPNSPKIGTLRAQQSAFIIAAFSQFLKDQEAAPSEAISYLKALQEDFEDGRVDGERAGQGLGSLHKKIAGAWSRGMLSAATKLAMGSNSSTFSGFDPSGLNFNASPSPVILGVESANATYQAVSNAADGFLELVPVGDIGNSSDTVLRGYPARVADATNMFWTSNDIVRFVAGAFYRGLSLIEDLSTVRTTAEKNGFSDGLRGDDRFGKVDYHFSIGKYEVTNNQYVAFLNAVAQTDPYYLFLPGISDSGQGGISRTGSSGSYSYAVRTGFGNKPVTGLTWFSCARFANWLHNGKPTGPASASTTEDGAYTLNGTMSDFNIPKNANAIAEIAFNYANPQPTASQPWGVTNNQYVEFLNAVAQTDTYDLYSASFAGQISRSGTAGNYVYSVTSGGANKVNGAGMSFWRAARYANWIHNSKPTGPQSASTTEDGAYTLNGANGPTPIVRNPGAKFSIPSEDEWYKAAYYKGSGLNSGYWDYPFQSDLAPKDDSKNNESGTLKDVGSYSSSPSGYGTLDQAGNAWEWNEGLILRDYAGNVGMSRGAMGTGNYRRASWRGWWTPHYVNGGMRVSARSVPTITNSASPTEITIRGGGFQTGVQVLVGSLECQVTQNTKKTIACVPPQLASGTYNITVTNPSGKTVTLLEAIRFQ